MKRGVDYTMEYFERCLMREEPFEVLPADHWSDECSGNPRGLPTWIRTP
jgi:hypothetical protein